MSLRWAGHEQGSCCPLMETSEVCVGSETSSWDSPKLALLFSYCAVCSVSAAGGELRKCFEISCNHSNLTKTLTQTVSLAHSFTRLFIRLIHCKPHSCLSVCSPQLITMKLQTRLQPDCDKQETNIDTFRWIVHFPHLKVRTSHSSVLHTEERMEAPPFMIYIFTSQTCTSVQRCLHHLPSYLRSINAAN